MKDLAATLSAEECQRMDQVCLRFEAAWHSGQSPRLEDFLCSPSDPIYPVLVRELILLDVHYRRAAGQEPQLRHYTERFPGVWIPWPELSTLAPDRSSLHDSKKQQDRSLLEGAFEPGTSVGQFELLERLGRGGMGVVYKARQQHPERLVALKIIRPDMLMDLSATERDRWVARFREEVSVVATLDHPHIVTLYEAGEHEGLPYYSMKYVEGGSLRSHLKDGPFQGLGGSATNPRQQQREVAGLIATVARAVHHAHQRGILHRDLTPANILLDPAGQPLVTDFGLSKRLDQDVTRPSGVVGVPAYMAPEQAACRRGAVAVAADIYSLGAIFYLLLTGRPPFQGDNPLETLKQVLDHEPVRPSELHVHVDRDLETVCLKCLRKESGQRYASAEALAEDLDNWLAGRAIKARPVGRMERAWRWCRLNPLVAVLFGSVFLLVTAIAVISTLDAWQLQESLDQTSEAKFAEHEAKLDAQYQLWAAKLSEAKALASSGRRGQRFASLLAIKDAQKYPVPPGRSHDELRDAAIAAVCLPDVDAGLEWDPDKGEPPTERGFQVHLDRQALFQRIPGPKFEVRGQGFSSDGQFVLTALEQYDSSKGWTVPVRLWRMEGTKLRQILTEAGVYEQASAFSSDSKLVALGHRDGTVSIRDTTSGQEIRRLKPGGTPYCLAYHPSLPRLAIGTLNSSGVFVFNGDGSSYRTLPHPRTVSGLSWSPDGRRLVVGCEDRRIYLWDVERGQLATPAWVGHKTEGIRVSFNRRGDRVVSNDWASNLRLWDAHSGRELFTTSERGYLYNEVQPEILGVEPRGRILKLLRVAEAQELREIYRCTATSREPMENMFVHPDGRLCITHGSAGLGTFDLTTGEAELLFPTKGIHEAKMDRAGNLWTLGMGGFLRWPVRPTPGKEADYEIGPPELVLPSLPPTRTPLNILSIDFDRTGQVIAFPQFDQGALVIFRGAQGSRRVRLQPQRDVRRVQVSLDGRWVATASHWVESGKGAIKIWEASSGRLLKELPLDAARFLEGFSPDGRWLVTTSLRHGFESSDRKDNFYRLWETGTWQEAGTIPSQGGIAWDQDVIVDGQLDGTLIVTQLSTRKELARITSPEKGRISSGYVLRSGYLRAIGPESKMHYVWDLPRIRAQLRELGLDWEGPPYFSEADMAFARLPYTVRVHAGSFGKER